MNDILRNILDSRYDILFSFFAGIIGFVLNSLVRNFYHRRDHKINIKVSNDEQNVEAKNIDSKDLLKKVEELKNMLEKLKKNNSEQVQANNSH